MRSLGRLLSFKSLNLYYPLPIFLERYSHHSFSISSAIFFKAWPFKLRQLILLDFSGTISICLDYEQMGLIGLLPGSQDKPGKT